MSDEVTFSPDLYRGTAAYYDRFRLSYPDTLISDLVHRTRPSGRGRLLDLACGTGQLAFALRSSFAEVWAVDQEPGMVEMVRSKAAALADHAAAFDDSISAELGPYARDGHLTETVSFAYELARRAPGA